MGIDKVGLKYDAIKAGNLSVGNNADGSMDTAPIFSWGNAGEVGMYAGLPLLMNGSQLKGSKATGGIQYTKGILKANTTWTGFNNIEWLTERTHQMETLMKEATPEWPKKLNGAFDAYSAEGKVALKDVFKEICEAPDRKALNQILNETVTVNGQQIPKRRVYNHLIKHLPTEVSNKLQNITRYREMYGKTLQNFQQAQTRLMSGKSIGPKGSIDVLHRQFARARAEEHKFITAKKGELGVERKVGVGKKTARFEKLNSKTKNWLAGSKKLRTFTRFSSKAFGAAAVIMSLGAATMEVAGAVSSAKPGEKWKDGSRQALKSGARFALESGGAWAGMKLGAIVGSFAGPIGTFIGGAVGAGLGYLAGKLISDNTEFINKSVPQEHAEEEQKVITQKICDAIENDDLETVYNYTSNFKEQVVDEQGNAVLDENGNPTFQIAKIYDDETKQKEFEQRVASLDNYVETEVVKQKRAEELKQEKAQQEQLRQQQLQQQQFYAGTPSYNTSFGTSYGTGTGYFGTVLPAYNFGSATNSNFYNFGTGSTSYSWQNPAWQNSLADRYNSSNFYSFDPNNYSMPWMFQQNKGFAA